MNDYQVAITLTLLVYGVVLFPCLRDTGKAAIRRVRAWYQRRSAEVDAGIKRVLDHKDPEIEARIASRERKCS